MTDSVYTCTTESSLSPSSSQDSEGGDPKHRRGTVESFFFARSHNPGLVMQIQHLGPHQNPHPRPAPLFNLHRKQHRLLKPVHGIIRSVEGAAGMVGVSTSRRHSDQFYATRHSSTVLSRNNSVCGRCKVSEPLSFDSIEMESSPPSPFLGDGAAPDEEEEDRGVYHVYTVDEVPQAAGKITRSDITFNVSASEADQTYLTVTKQQSLPKDSFFAFLATPITWHLTQVGARTYRLVDSSTDYAIGYWTGERGWRFVSKGETLMSLSEKVRVHTAMIRKPMYLDQVVHRLRSKYWTTAVFDKDQDSSRRRRRVSSGVSGPPIQNYRVTLVDAILFSAIQLLMQQQLPQAVDLRPVLTSTPRRSVSDHRRRSWTISNAAKTDKALLVKPKKHLLKVIPVDTTPATTSHFHDAVNAPSPAVQAIKKRNLVARFFKKLRANMK